MANEIYVEPTATEAAVILVGGQCYERVGASERPAEVGPGDIQAEFDGCDKCQTRACDPCQCRYTVTATGYDGEGQPYDAVIEVCLARDEYYVTQEETEPESGEYWLRVRKVSDDEVVYEDCCFANDASPLVESDCVPCSSSSSGSSSSHSSRGSSSSSPSSSSSLSVAIGCENCENLTEGSTVTLETLGTDSIVGQYPGPETPDCGDVELDYNAQTYCWYGICEAEFDHRDEDFITFTITSGTVWLASVTPGIEGCSLTPEEVQELPGVSTSSVSGTIKYDCAAKKWVVELGESNGMFGVYYHNSQPCNPGGVVYGGTLCVTSEVQIHNAMESEICNTLESDVFDRCGGLPVSKQGTYQWLRFNPADPPFTEFSELFGHEYCLNAKLTITP